MEPFNQSDPFDIATEAMRKEIADLIHRYWTEAPEVAGLDPEARFQVIATALTVSLAATMKIMVNAPEKQLIQMIRGSLPAAFATAAGIIDDPAEVRH
ncbi:hypothetical protein [Rhizobium laguerreae]|uniref:Uncharacterized protein n=1 Tax=Rhizobium laguerreae TaxID=1076926 RepID=A0A7Y2RBX2_9HYPH|nr:hypothetical protein [Rhizobium laguerreae]NNH67780.1 hypothetical protein [Rhizobium laguerreae]